MADPTPLVEKLRPTRRPYRSPRRAQQAQATRQAVLAAATRLFLTQGWTATSMRDIARVAGVAPETIYKHFGSKTDLLLHAIDVAVTGDDAPVPVAERAEFLAIGQGSRAERLAAVASLLAGIHERTAGFTRVLAEGATADEAIAAALHDSRERRRRDVEGGATLVLGREPTEEERDGLWALLSPEIYLLLVEHSGWGMEQYRSWVATTLDAVVPRT